MSFLDPIRELRHTSWLVRFECNKQIRYFDKRPQLGEKPLQRTTREVYTTLVSAPWRADNDWSGLEDYLIEKLETAFNDEARDSFGEVCSYYGPVAIIDASCEAEPEVEDRESEEY